MSVTLTAINASPTTINPGGGSTTLTPTYSDPSQTITITGVDENGNQASVVVTINPEAVTLVAAASLPTHAPAGQIVFAASPSGQGTLSVDAGGTTLTYTAN